MANDARVQLIELISARRKTAQQKICRELEINVAILADLALSARHGLLSPYHYACSFKDWTPLHLDPGKVDFGVFRDGDVATKRKALNVIFQYDRERRHVALHLLYSQCRRFWHLFYFDQRDVERHVNHSKIGPHIHYVSDLYCALSADKVWERALNGDLRFGAKEHIRFSWSPEGQAF